MITGGNGTIILFVGNYSAHERLNIVIKADELIFIISPRISDPEPNLIPDPIPDPIPKPIPELTPDHVIKVN